MQMYQNIIHYLILYETLWAFVLFHFEWFGIFCSSWGLLSLFFWPIIAGWGSLLPVSIESRQVFDIQGTILFHLNDYVAIKCFKTELPPTVCKLFDEEKHHL